MTLPQGKNNGKHPAIEGRPHNAKTLLIDFRRNLPSQRNRHFQSKYRLNLIETNAMFDPILVQISAVPLKSELFVL